MFGHRLKLARKSAGLSLAALAARTRGRISARAIAGYERAELKPDSTVVITMADALDVSTTYLLAPSAVSLEGVEFRKRGSTSVRDCARVEMTVLDHVDRYLQVEAILGISGQSWPKPKDAPYRIRTLEEVENAVQKVRTDWNLGGQPIPDMTALLEERGIKVLKLELPEAVDGLTCSAHRRHRENVAIIVCNSIKTIERQRLTLAHELGHLLLKPVAEMNEEKICQRFAGAFLAPKEILLYEIGRRRQTFWYDEFIEIKMTFGISAAALLIRLRDVGIIDDSTCRNIFRGTGRTWRKVEPRPLTRREPGTRFRRLCIRALAEKEISPSKAVELLELPRSEIDNITLMPER